MTQERSSTPMLSSIETILLFEKREKKKHMIKIFIVQLNGQRIEEGQV